MAFQPASIAFQSAAMAFQPASIAFQPAAMALQSAGLPSSSSSSHHHLRLPHQQPPSGLSLRRSLPLRLRASRPQLPPLPLALSSAGGNNNNSDDDGTNSGNGGGGDGEGDGGASDGNRREVLFVLAQLGRKLETLPADLAAAVEGRRVTGETVRRFAEMEGSPLLRWLLQFRGFRERLLTDDLFLAKIAMECGVGIMIIAQIAAEYEKIRENFLKEIDIVISDVVTATVTEFMLVYLPAPTVSLQPPLATNARLIANSFHNCSDNAFQIPLPLPGRSFSLLQRLGAVVRNGAKLFAVGNSASLTAAEYEKRMENFVVLADAPPLARNEGLIADLFHNRPDNALEIALAERSFSRANAGADLDELHSPISPMHRGWTKYIGLDIHFSLEKGLRISFCISFGNVATAVGC